MARILILEPAEDVRGLVALVVRRLGHEPHFPSSTSEPSPDVDAVVLEPSWKRGLAIARTLRQRDGRLPLVCVSVWPAEELGADVAALGARRYLLKPFSVAELTEALTLVVEKRP